MLLFTLDYKELTRKTIILKDRKINERDLLIMKYIKQTFLNISIVICILFAHNTSTWGQVGINTSTPNSTLDVTSPGASITQVAGVQGSRLTLAELAAKGNTLYGTDQVGAIIYVTNISGGNKTGQRQNINALGYYYFDGSFWQKLNKTKPVVRGGDIMQSFQSADHDGWYLLDGRAVSALPALARTAAATLGFTSSLPDSRDRVLKAKSASEALVATGGANSISINKANLPNTSLSGTIAATLASAGAHTHAASGSLVAGGAHTHSISGSLLAGGAHTHPISGTLASGGGHTHAVNGSLGSAGAHTHNFTTIYVMPGTAKDVDRGYSAGSLWSYLAISNYNTTSSGNHNHTVNTTLTAGGGHTHTVSGGLASADAHTHAVNGSLALSDVHSHTVAATLASNGAHTHTVSGTTTLPLGGTQAAMDNRSAYLVVNTFIYLGQ